MTNTDCTHKLEWSGFSDNGEYPRYLIGSLHAAKEAMWELVNSRCIRWIRLSCIGTGEVVDSWCSIHWHDRTEDRKKIFDCCGGYACSCHWEHWD